MAYNLYTSEQVFTDNNINAICNAMFDALITEFSENTLNQKFAVTGSVAKIIQGAANTPVYVIPFITNDVAVYDFLHNNISSIILTEGVIGFTDHFQVITSRVYIEFWKTQSVLTLIDSNGIFSQSQIEIPNYIL